MSVHDAANAEAALWAILLEPEYGVNIERPIPTFEQHCAFVRSRPYEAWYLIVVDEEVVGTCWLTAGSEIGLFVLRRHQRHGHGSQAIGLLMERHGAGHYRAVINERNAPSIACFLRGGFKLTHYVYEAVR